jgi:hypothetical protein
MATRTRVASSDINDYPDIKKWIAKNPEPGKNLQRIVNLMVGMYVGEKHRWINEVKPEYRFDPVGRGYVTEIKANKNHVTINIPIIDADGGSFEEDEPDYVAGAKGEYYRRKNFKIPPSESLNSLRTFLQKTKSFSKKTKLPALAKKRKTENSVETDVDYEAIEGEPRLVTHFKRERNSKLAEQKKKAAKNLRCEACSFDFEKVYGETHGKGFCEVHHKVPLGVTPLAKKNALADLAILCSNCHRIIHRMLRNDPRTTVADLTQLIEKQEVWKF